MKINQKQVRNSLIVAILIAVLCASSYYYGVSPSYVGDTGELWVNPPFSEASYVVGQYNSTYYYAKNCTTGKYDFGNVAVSAGYVSSNATYVIQACQGDNRTVFVKGGDYYINYGILITSRHFTLVGEGAGATTFIIGANGGITFTRSASATFRYNNKVLNIKFDGQNVASYAVRSRKTDAGNLILENFEVGWCWFTGFDTAGAHPLDLTGLEGGSIHNNLFDAGYTQIYLWEDGTYEAGNCKIVDNSFYIPHSSSVGVMINCSSNDADSGVGAITVEDNHFLGDDNGAYAVVIDTTASQVTCGHNKILRNRCEDCNIVKTVSPTQYIKYTEIKDNDAKSASGSIIDLCQNTSVSEICGNILYASVGSVYFIKDACDSSTVSEINRFYDNCLYGTALVSFTGYSYVANNKGLNPLSVSTLYRASAGSISFYGIYGNWNNGTVYTIRTTDMFLCVTGGAGVNITLYDKNNVQMITNLGAGIYPIAWGQKFKIVYTSAPTVVFDWK